jgi:methionyl-tRNA formyltransferase
MKIVYMGTPGFAVAPLERLYGDGRDVVGVFTQPDKPRNRGMKLSFSPVKEVAIANGTPVYQPLSLKDSGTVDILRGLKCELIVVVAYGKLLPRQVLELPSLGCVNIHASLLPRYRGAAPIQWAVLNGERETGVTSMYMDEELDAGDILYTKKTAIGDNETAEELYFRLSALGAGLLSETIYAVSRGEAVRVPQNHSEATYAPLLKKDMSPIDWTKTAQVIKCKVRGLIPWPIATTTINGAIVKVFSVEAGNKTEKSPGEIVNAGQSGIEVACADGTVIIKELQPPGGKRMAAADYLRGHPICI